ncbi:hypothetical protein EZS27_030473 [termite gut metagenome]|uniref:Uncharacterized protein n=1 Tax=termite gut metagenome TaxID=433724 RepID=A0A5J4QDY3_9ZZZZ
MEVNPMKEKDDIGGRKSKNEQIEDYLQERYDFRFNTVKFKPEFRPKNENHPFSPVTNTKPLSGKMQ